MFIIASSKKIICRAFSHTEKYEKGAGYNTIQARRCAHSFLVLQIKEADLCTQVPRHVSAMGIGEKKIDGKLEQGELIRWRKPTTRTLIQNSTGVEGLMGGRLWFSFSLEIRK